MARPARCRFFGFLRGEEKFDGLDALDDQMKRDEAEARALLAGVRPLSDSMADRIRTPRPRQPSRPA